MARNLYLDTLGNTTRVGCTGYEALEHTEGASVVLHGNLGTALVIDCVHGMDNTSLKECIECKAVDDIGTVGHVQALGNVSDGSARSCADGVRLGGRW